MCVILTGKGGCTFYVTQNHFAMKNGTLKLNVSLSYFCPGVVLLNRGHVVIAQKRSVEF